MTESTGLVTYRVEPAQPGADGLVAYLTLNELAEVRHDRRLRDRAADLERQLVADEPIERLAVRDPDRPGQLRVEVVVEPLLDEPQRSRAVDVHERGPREQVVARGRSVRHDGRALDAYVRRHRRLLGWRRRALRDVVGGA